MDDRAIGIFDSGLGGLTALSELERLLPGEKLIYFADSGHMPYGGRQPEEIIGFTEKILGFLLGCGVKQLLVACGTSSSVAMPVVGGRFGIPWVDVIAPASDAAVSLTRSGRVGVLATEATVRSGAYERALLTRRKDLRVFSSPAPELVPLIEGGHTAPGDPLLREAVARSVAPLLGRDIDTLILGCTHYPLISEAIGLAVGGEVRLVNNGGEAARALRDLLQNGGLCAGESGKGESRFYVTGDRQDFAAKASRVLGRDLEGSVFAAKL